MAKTARKGAAKKPSAPPAIKPVKQTLTKSALINLLAEENEIPRKTAVGVYTTLENLESRAGTNAARGPGQALWRRHPLARRSGQLNWVCERPAL